MSQIYIRPVGLIAGDAAQAAMTDGWALPLAGGASAFTGCEVWQRRRDGFTRAILPAARLSAWTLGGEEHEHFVAAALSALADLSLHHAEPQVADHILAYHNTRSLLRWYDAPTDPIFLSPSIGERTTRTRTSECRRR